MSGSCQRWEGKTYLEHFKGQVRKKDKKLSTVDEVIEGKIEG